MTADSEISPEFDVASDAADGFDSACSSGVRRIDHVILTGETLDRLDAAVLRTRPDGSILGANAAALACYGYSHAEMLSLSMHDLGEPTDHPRIDPGMRDAVERGALLRAVHRRSDSTLFPVEIRFVPAGVDGKATLLTFVRDITDNEREREELRESEQMFRTISESVSDVVWVLDPKTLRFLYISPSVQSMTGFTPEEAMSRPLDAPLSPECARALKDRIDQRTQDFVTGKESPERWYTEEMERTRKDGSTIWIELTATLRFNEKTDLPEAYGVTRDITERKQADTYREVSREILQILNEPEPLRDSVGRVIAALKTRTGLDAVGIRLQDGDDFPYVAQEGFSQDFLRTENSLLDRDADGAVCRDEDGSPSLGCTCGLVISGKTDSAGSYFTQGGSFWTNNSLPLLDLPSDQDPRHRPRNECVHHGYVSMALVPIRNTDGIVGLLHLNDRRAGRFSSATVELLEGVAAHIGEALMRKMAEERLIRYQTRLREFAAELLVSGEHEQRRLGDELHEGVGQVLAAAKMAAQVLAAEPLEAPALEQVQRLMDLLGESISEVRSLTSQLAPVVLFEIGLGSALLWLRDKYSELHDLRCTVSADEESERLHGQAAMFMFRVAREALDNVVHHSQVLRATVTVTGTDGWHTVSVSDRGVGFNPALIDNPGDVAGFGLFSIREECLSMGGSMEILSSLGQGTRIRVRVPVAADPVAEN